MAADTTEIGVSGLRIYSGQVREEFLPQLTGSRAIRVYEEMSSNDPLVGALLFALTQLIRRVTWRAEPEGEAPEDREAADFALSNLHDMSVSWGVTLSEILSMLVYGWSFHEIVYKVRSGPSEDSARNSRYTDGRIGWRKLARRAQGTLSRWGIDEGGGVSGMHQTPPTLGGEVFIPIEKGLLFRPIHANGSPEGRSILRAAYRPWFFKKRIEEVEGIGIERDLAGLPVMYIPAEYMQADASAEKKAVLEEYKSLVKGIRRDSQEGVVLPSVYDKDGRRLVELTLLSSGGKRNFDTGGVIARYDQRIAMTVLADIILLGHEKVGSYGLGVTKAELFAAGIESILDEIVDVMNRHALPRLLALNGMRGRCRFAVGGVERVSLTELGAYIQQLAGAQVLLRDDALEAHLREVANLPAIEGAAQKRRPFGAGRTPGSAKVGKASGADDGEEILQVADRLSPKLRRAFLRAIGRLRGKLDRAALEAALGAGDVDAIERILGSEVTKAELQPLVQELERTFAAAGQASADALTTRLGVTTPFEVANHRAIAWLQEAGARLVTAIDEQQRAALREVLVELVQEGASPASAARRIQMHIGQTERDSRAIRNFAQRLREEGALERDVQRRTARYARRKLEDRAKLIAEHESLEAAAAGQRESWAQASEAGHLPPTTRRRIVVTPDERTCRICQGLGAKSYGMDEEVIPGHVRPPFHVRCRCAVKLVWEEEPAANAA